MIGFITNSFSQQLAFPSAEGFGKYATGGRGGSVIKVTNLNNSGSGSLRSALEASGTRTIVFEVGGTINLSSNIYVNDGNFTLAGQTAPGDGILIRGAMIQIERSNAIIRYIRFRPGPTAPNGADALNITAWGGFTVEDIIIDHCSLSWADDENFDIRAVGSGVIRDITIQHSIISEAGKGALAGEGTFNKTYYKNLFAHNSERNIRTNFPEAGTFDFEMINNLIYGFRYGTIPSLGNKFTVLNNKYKESNDTNVLVTSMIEGSTSGQGIPSETHAYLSGNILVPGTQQNNSALNPYLENTPYLTSGIQAIEASQIENNILDHVGASLPTRDQVDIRIVNQYINSNGSTASSGTYPTISGGTAPEDTDNDGMPDFWEVSNNLNINDPSDRNIIQEDGYTNLEYYLNGMSLTQQVSAGDDQTSCLGEPITLSASGAISYIWNTGETTQDITVNPDTTTTYTVTGTHENGSTTSDTVTVTISQFPIARAGACLSYPSPSPRD